MDGMGHIPRVWFSLTKSKVRDAIQERFQVNDVSEFLKELAGRHPFETKHKSWNRLSIFRPRSSPNSFWELGRLDPYFLRKKKAPGQAAARCRWMRWWVFLVQLKFTDSGSNRQNPPTKFSGCFFFLLREICVSRMIFAGTSTGQVAAKWAHGSTFLFKDGGGENGQRVWDLKKVLCFFDISGVISWCLGFFTRKIGEMIQFDEHGFSRMGA